MTEPGPAPPPAPRCLHCGLPVAEAESGAAGGDRPFCCSGCAAAYSLVAGLGLADYYRRRTLDPNQRPLKPEDADAVGGAVDLAGHVRTENGRSEVSLVVEGLHCAACVWLIESVLAREPGVISARINMTTRRLALAWRDGESSGDHLVDVVRRLGYRLVPFDTTRLDSERRRRERELVRAMAVAGFAAGNVMLLSVSIWAGAGQGMGPATRDLLHWVSALIAMPAIAYAGRPFFRQALSVLRMGHTSMDVPISLGVLLATAMSLYQTARGAEHAYFDSAIGLLFFLLVGRYLDLLARGRARSAAEHLLALGGAAVTVVGADGEKRVLAPARVEPGMTVLVAAGERIGVDGRIAAGVSDVDTALIDGESTPKPVAPGASVFAGTLNLTAPLRIAVTAVGDGTLLAEIARLIEAAEHQRGRYVALADRVARLYAPVVHSLAALTFLGWWLGAGATWQDALLIAIAVLIITCPCALALAVPVVHVVASGRLLRRGVLLKSGTALERLAVVDTIVFDKTGTLTLGRPRLVETAGASDPAALAQAAALAAASRHPLARALTRAAEARGVPVAAAGGVSEVPGAGLERRTAGGVTRLGSRAFVGADAGGATDVANGAMSGVGPELWLARPGEAAVRFAFADAPREDARAVVAALRRLGCKVELLSGDREAVVAAVAAEVGIETWRADCRPGDKVRRLESSAGRGARVMMVGDGLNDAPALAAASVSLSPATAVDVSQTAADLVFQGDRLAPVVEVLEIARQAQRLVKQNLALAFLYNATTIPLAIAGLVTPLIAAIAMSTSSLVVIVNALRLNRGSVR
ncbi:MAG: heavy metal translocating P-type ATPase metal-binding domain-containing protein [Rhodospirillales bacterium]|nr:heavy metal translocating P-type ATPase metal-binding domain-containing protein [Rhodospirillales bacterium]